MWESRCEKSVCSELRPFNEVASKTDLIYAGPMIIYFILRVYRQQKEVCDLLVDCSTQKSLSSFIGSLHWLSRFPYPNNSYVLTLYSPASSMLISDFVWKVHCARGAIRFSSRGLNSFTEWPKFAPKSHYCWHLSWNVTKTFIFFLPLQLQTAPYFDTFLFQIHFFIIVVLGFLFGTTMYLVFL